MLDAMAGRDPVDWNQPPLDYPARPLRSVSVEGLRVAYWRAPPCGVLDADVATVCDQVAHRLAEGGANIETLVLPEMDLLAIFNVLWLSGAARRLRALLKIEKNFSTSAYERAPRWRSAILRRITLTRR